MAKIRVIVLNDKGYKIVEVQNDYKSIRSLVSWECAWNTPLVQVCGQKYMIICSDLGKLEKKKISCLGYTNLISPKETVQEPFICDEVIITKWDGNDDYETLNDLDIGILESRLYTHQKKYLRDFFPTILVLD